MNYLTFLLFGALGGLARGLVGAYKHSLEVGKTEGLDIQKLLFNITVSTVVGAIVGMAVDMNPITSLCGGYAGLDIIDSVIKLKSKFPLPVKEEPTEVDFGA